MESDWLEYYCREKLFVKVCDVAGKCGEDVKWQYYRGLGLALAGRVSEAISCLAPVLAHAEFGLAAAHVSLIAHLSCESVDREAVSQLEWKVEEGEGGGERALQVAASALAHAGHQDKARGYVERLLRRGQTSAATLVLSGWLHLADGNTRAAARAFKTALTQDKNNVDGVLGEVATLGPTDALARLNQLVVRYPSAPPPLVEKMRLQLAARDWPQALDTAARILKLDPNNLAALQVRALHHLVVEGDVTEAGVALRRYGAEVETQRGVAGLLEAARVVGAVSGRHPAIIAETTRMAERATQLAPHNTAALLELAGQHRAAGRLTDAAKLYRTVTKIDDTCTPALVGLTSTQMAQSGATEQVLQQVEFLAEVVGSEPDAELLLVRAQCERDSSLLDKAAELLRSAAAAFPYGPQHLIHLNPDTLVRIADLYPDTMESQTKRVVVLRQVVDACPGLASAALGLARALVTAGDLTAAAHTANQLLTQVDSTNTDAHLVLAQIHLAQERYDDANASLELGLSHNLQARERPVYHVLLGAIQRHAGDSAACTHSMRTALTLNNGQGDHRLSKSELGTLYVELVSSLVDQGQAEEAEAVLGGAAEALAGTDQLGRLTVARADLATVRGDYGAALTLLTNIRPDHPYYLQARKKMADIQLHKLKDSRAYAECYRQLVASQPTTENLILLGDAYMAIQEPELAVETYEQALKGSSGPLDPQLSARLGRVLVRTHQYGKAIKCFRDSGAEGSLELAELLVRLGQLEAAETALADQPLTQKAFVLAKIREKSGDTAGAMKVMKEAREGLGPAEVALNAKMCARLAEYSSALREYDSAISYYKRALQYRPADTTTEIALAKLYMQVNDWSSCQAVCSTVLARDPDNEPSLLMLADLAYRRVDFNDAAQHFSALLVKHPAYWVALARLIEVRRRLAQLDLARPFLEAAAQAAPGQPGLSYCTGLYDWYSGNMNSALHHFNAAREDGEWGQQAVHNMVEVCLTGGGGDGGTAMATRLLGHMRPHSGEEEQSVRLLHNLTLLAGRDKQDVDLAMADLTSLAAHDNLRVGALLGLATGYVQQKQVARARNTLKRVARAAWLVEEAEYLERCWLLLADLHVQAGKMEPAAELLRRVLAHNQSCHRAHQLLAFIAEKEQKYVDAGFQYRQAWKLSGESDPALGFKLAFSLVKAKRYADAVSTCHAVLRLDPEYPRIRKEILDKAVAHLRC